MPDAPQPLTPSQVRFFHEEGYLIAPAVFAPGAPIAIGALGELSDRGGRGPRYFIGPGGGGLEVSHEGHSVLVLTPQSPLGRQLLGKRVGETIHVPGRDRTQTRQIVAVQ